MLRTKLIATLASVALAASAAAVMAPAALANSHTTCRIVVTDLGPTLKIVYTVHSHAANRAYGVRLTVDGERVFADRLRTDADHRIRVRIDVQDHPGSELIQGRAREVATGAVCLATVQAPVG